MAMFAPLLARPIDSAQDLLKSRHSLTKVVEKG